VPLENVAVDGEAVAEPRLVTVMAVPPAITLVPVKATVAAAVELEPKVTTQVCPAVPATVPPLVYVAETTPVGVHQTDAPKVPPVVTDIGMAKVLAMLFMVAELGNTAPKGDTCSIVGVTPRICQSHSPG
jgi:hypothetical protein